MLDQSIVSSQIWKRKYGSISGRAPPAMGRHASAHHCGALRPSLLALQVSILDRASNLPGLEHPNKVPELIHKELLDTKNMKQLPILAAIPEMASHDQNLEPVSFLATFCENNRPEPTSKVSSRKMRDLQMAAILTAEALKEEEGSRPTNFNLHANSLSFPITDPKILESDNDSNVCVKSHSFTIVEKKK